MNYSIQSGGYYARSDWSLPTVTYTIMHLVHPPPPLQNFVFSIFPGYQSRPKRSKTRFYNIVSGGGGGGDKVHYGLCDNGELIE